MRKDVTYQLSVFGDFRDITPDTDTISQMMESLKSYNMVPSVYQEGKVNFNPSNPEKVYSESVDRLGMISSDNSLNISFGLDRIDITADAPSINNPLDDTILSKVMDIFRKTINDLSFSRIALNTTSFFTENDSEKICEHSQSNIGFYNNFEELSLRLNKKQDFEINGKNEQVNVILISQMSPEVFKGTAPPIPLSNGWMIQFDINTTPENIKNRFGSKAVEDFMNIAKNTKERIIGELLE
ncbi:hypothetical protein [Lactococcus petauri]|uniref:hypothetical protein n=1 Tax=Lactococcus petauri TaxID=1940789 RepID=UPI0021D4C2D5|nr:hypothetical protein [Lactococcus petauri]MCU7363667.1 hypothetical protein [Lactococcus petauri]MDA3734935.1 hypothetical protein [Lactococcus petauri]MDC7842311.1 hypothetical protein [Lactococcus petauri]